LNFGVWSKYVVWIFIEKDIWKTYGRVLYRREINQPAVTNSIWISGYGSYMSYGFSYGPFRDGSTAQRVIFWPYLLHLNSDFGDLKFIGKLRIIFIILSYHLSHFMIFYDQNLLWFTTDDLSWCRSCLSVFQSCSIALFCSNYHTNCMIPVIANKT
jgi:hypothetical protein